MRHNYDQDHPVVVNAVRSLLNEFNNIVESSPKEHHRAIFKETAQVFDALRIVLLRTVRKESLAEVEEIMRRTKL